MTLTAVFSGLQEERPARVRSGRMLSPDRYTPYANVEPPEPSMRSPFGADKAPGQSSTTAGPARRPPGTSTAQAGGLVHTDNRAPRDGHARCVGESYAGQEPEVRR
jgi:hypothetical protein